VLTGLYVAHFVDVTNAITTTPNQPPVESSTEKNAYLRMLQFVLERVSDFVFHRENCCNWRRSHRIAFNFVGISSYRVDPDPDQIRAEIMDHGPIQVEMMVYEDFLSYKSGQ